MLLQVSIRNFALIGELTLEFSKGLNVLTGETGAGKSIIIDALQLTLGSRCETSQFKSSDKTCVIESVFALSKSLMSNSQLFEPYMGADDEYLIIKREITPDGRSKNYINGQFVNLSVLKEVGGGLVDLHGQYDHQKIFDPASHLEIINRLASSGKNKAVFNKSMESYQNLFKDYSELVKQRQHLESLKEKKDRELDLLTYQVKEIENVNPVEGEEEELKEEAIRLAHAEKLFEITDRLKKTLDEGDESASSSVSLAFRDMQEWFNIDSKAGEIKDSLEDVQIKLEELLAGIRDYQDTLSFDSDRLKDVEERLDGIATIKRKYGGSITEALRYLFEAKDKLDQLVNSEVYSKEIDEKIKKMKPELSALADTLTVERKKAISSLSKSIEKELNDLGIKNSQFTAKHKRIPFVSSGQDEIEFLLSPNAGVGLMPLAKIASGGEAARVMVAIKKSLAKADTIPTLIFDEIDANIGGRLGEQVGKKVKSIASERQVLLITHLPQIASFADKHFKIVKSVENDQTKVACAVLDGEKRVQELSQMMSGSKESNISKAHAREMLEGARQ